MTDRHSEDHSGEQEPALDHLIRSANRARASESAPTLGDAGEILEYLHGEADESTAERLRALLAGSAEARRDLVELVRDLDQLEQHEVRARFEAAMRAAPAAPITDPAGAVARPASRDARPSWSERLIALFRTPAFAYAFTFALMCYPTYRFLVDRDGAPAVVETTNVSLRATARLRGTDTPPVTVSATSGWIELTLWSEARFAPGERHRLSASQGSRTIWRSDDFGGLREVDGSDAYVLLLNAALFAPGEIRIEVERIDPAGAVTSTAEYELVLD